MPEDPFPLSPGDAEEPDGCPLPAAGETGPEDDWDGLAGQGLYVCLPPEQLTLAGFAQGGETDTMAPGPLLAAVVHTVTGQDGSGLAGCSDDQLMGIISAARRMRARADWTQLAAVAEYAARHAGSRPADEFAPVELAYELHLTPQSAAGQMQFSAAVAARLPATFAALGAGQVDPVQLRIIDDETQFLGDQDAATADQMLAGQAPGLTYGELRRAAHKLVLKLDPETARKRKEAARGEAHVRRFREDSGNGGMVARELPSDEVLASWQHVEQRALDLRGAGLPGSLRELRVRAYLDLLQERDSRDRPAVPVPVPVASPGQSPPDSEPPGDDHGGPSPGGPGTGRGGADSSGDPGSGPGGPDAPGSGPGTPGGPGRNGPGGPALGPRPAAGPSVAALVTLTIPLATWQGRSDAPGEAGGFGLLDGDDARDLATAAARHPATRWCITALNPDGTAAAHGCLPGRHPPPPGTSSATVTPGPTPGPDPPPGTGPRDWIAGLRIAMTSIARGTCSHDRAEPGYHPSRTLAHLIRARNARCTAPGCGRPAARCDLDHTMPWDQGGLTCECDLAPLCRRHHRCKQAEGWRLEQPEPGVLIWRTPAGRSYATRPTQYPL